MDKKSDTKPGTFKRCRLAISLIALITVALVVLLFIDALVTPPKWQKHKWMLTETFGTGLTSLDMFNMSLDEMDKWLLDRGFERARVPEENPDNCRVWEKEKVELIYAAGNRHFLIVTDVEHPTDWRLDSGVNMSQFNNDMCVTYGVPDKAFPRSFYYYYMPNSSKCIIVAFGYDQIGSIVSVGYGLKQRSLLDRVFFRLP